ncbi:helix-turn-helix domain-containing protein [Providencia stuartii]|uniref:helix-turn-helix domain-containing protein n=1 Tax=Providencia stuartii TaxID=588 RepID=UPI0024B21289
MEENRLTALAGLFLRKARKEKNITGKQLAKLMGISQQQISRYENGITPLTLDLLHRFLLTLDQDGLTFMQKIFHEYHGSISNKPETLSSPPPLSQYIKHFIKDKNC